jgi:NAD(P)-dependent dehydrogenase (short-subunit alcohol dehydrogenase family)
VTLPSFSLAGKTAFITGGRRGIGRAFALAFAESGADVAVCDRTVSDGELKATAAEIQKLGRRSLALQADVTAAAEVEKAVRETIDKLGAIDILVNDAAMNIGGGLMAMPEETWDKIIDTDLKGYYLVARAVGNHMMARKKGVIINMASTAAMFAVVDMSAYCIAKAGVVMMTRVLALELARYNIRVNAIAPTMVKTKFSEPLWREPKDLKEWEAGIPLGRIEETGDLVGAALYLASDASAYVTGHTLVVDGGSAA